MTDYDVDYGPYSLRIKDIKGERWVTVTGPLHILPKPTLVKNIRNSLYSTSGRLIDIENGYFNINDTRPHSNTRMVMRLGRETTFMYRSGLAVILNNNITTYCYYGIVFKKQKQLFLEYIYLHEYCVKKNELYVNRAKCAMLILDCLCLDLQLMFLEAIE